MKLIGFQLGILSIIYGYETSATPPFKSWDISVDGEIDIAPVEGSSDIILTMAAYNTSDRDIEISFMTPDCKNKLKHSLVGEPYIVNETRIGGFRQFDVKARLDGAELFFGSDRDEIYDGDASRGFVSLCVSNTNYMTDGKEKKIPVNTVNVAVNIHTDTRTSSLILPDIDLKRSVVLQTKNLDIRFDHLITIYLCDPSDTPIDLARATDPKVYPPGSTLSICIADKLGGDNRVTGVNQLTVSQRRSDGADIDFEYVRTDADGNGVSDGELVHVGTSTAHDVVVVTVQLVTEFFDGRGSGPLCVTGEVALGDGGGRRLDLQNRPGRLLASVGSVESSGSSSGPSSRDEKDERFADGEQVGPGQSSGSSSGPSSRGEKNERFADGGKAGPSHRDKGTVRGDNFIAFAVTGNGVFKAAATALFIRVGMRWFELLIQSNSSKI